MTPTENNAERPLHRRWIVVTRPAHAAASLCSAIESAGGNLIRCPLLAIEPVTPRDTGRDIADYSAVIFISANAVCYGRSLLSLAQRADAPTMLAAGAATAAALRKAGVNAVVSPPRSAGSEGLLGLPALQPDAVAKRDILIVRGQGGREHLAEVLRKRGASVDYIEVYRRTKPQAAVDLGPYWQRGQLDVIIITSGESLTNLVAMAGNEHRAHLMATKLLVVSKRIAQQARRLGFTEAPLVTEDISDAGMVRALAGWSSANRLDL